MSKVGYDNTNRLSNDVKTSIATKPFRNYVGYI